ncbi:MAG: ATP-binding protein [Deltaproteobacteria bacterium]|nr:ATP-binding protein [Deltaproteobacteria bacterium]
MVSWLMPIYLRRHLASRLREFLGQFPVVLLLGARQVGKTTLLENELEGWRKVDLEDAATHEIVAADPALFLRDRPHRVWFDEAQRCPELFAAIRVAIDRDRQPGRYVLSGSASPALVRSVSESLAGRAGVLELDHLTTSETHGRAPPNFLGHLLGVDSAEALLAALHEEPHIPERLALDRWVAGGYPEPWLLRDPVKRTRWHEAYLQLVAERDLSELSAALRAPAVRRLLRMLAARQGQVVNQAALARDFGVSSSSMGRFLDILDGTRLWRRLPAYHVNLGKRLVRRPKGYLRDTGLLHALSGVVDFDSLRVNPLLGPSWEGFVVSELLAALGRMDSRPDAYFWSTHQGAEVDLVLERGGRLWPVEIKHATHLRPMQLRGLRSFLDDFRERAPFGVVVHRGEEPSRLSERVVGVPIGWVVA